MAYAHEYIDDLTTKLTTEYKRKNVSVAVLVWYAQHHSEKLTKKFKDSLVDIPTL